jgi:hypothetical protein
MTKREFSTFKIFALATFLFTSCNFDPKDKFMAKQEIGICQSNHGMVTYEAVLYSDSTFYIPTSTLIDFSFGEFHIKEDTFLFTTRGGDVNLCEKYSYTRSKDNSKWYDLKPLACETNKSLNILFSK